MPTPTTQTDPTVRAAWARVMEHMRGQRWDQAAACLSSLAPEDPAAAHQLCLCRNLAAVRQVRPTLYAALLRPGRRAYQIVTLPTGRRSLAWQDPQGEMRLMGAGENAPTDPGAMVAALGPNYQTGPALGVLGLGDGQLVDALSLHPPKLFMDQEQAVSIFEPDPGLLLACMMIHDWSGPTSPLLAERFSWYVGGDWQRQFESSLRADAWAQPPRMLLSVPRQGAEDELAGFEAWLSGALKRAQAEQDQVQRRLDAHYARVTPTALAATLGGTGPRPPRALLMTSRFTTVLQYAIRDTQAALDRMGWSTRVLIEPSPSRRIMPATIRRVLADFEPDLVLCIDHLRYEVPGLYPRGLLHVCWIQDHLNNLTSRQAGASIGRWDYTLSFAGPMFIRSYGYPAARMIDVPMMLAALEPPPPPPEEERGAGGSATGQVDDLLYVSNVSGRPAEIVPEILKDCRGALVEVVSEVAEKIVKTYERGGSIATLIAIKRMLDEASRSRGLRMAAEARNPVADRLWGQLNSALYRQQALAWAADAADALGLRLSVYGRGWEHHPRFGRYARGVVMHGPELAGLMHRGRINLCLEPYTCFAHHRLLDGLMSGGFFLVRDHPSHVWLPRLSALLAELGQGADAPRDTGEALAAAGSRRESLEQLLRTCQDLTYDPEVDPVTWVRSWERAGVLRGAQIALPDLEAVSFADAAECRRKIEHFMAEPDERRAISGRQRQNVAERLTFDAGLKRAFGVLTRRLAEEPGEAPTPSGWVSDVHGAG